ncbi:MAG TPA: hypothetical protein VEW71_07020 [Allosphingosinicella sp.]|nr:hypothetical protein [Allosphingosinicella sp.]
MRRVFAAGLCIFISISLPSLEAAPPAVNGALAPRIAEPGERTQYCPRLMDVTTVEACDDVDVRVGRLEIGTGRLAPPNLVYRDSGVTVLFEVSRARAPSSLEEGAEVRVYDRIPLSRFMSAVLVGEGFRIDPAPTPGQNGGVPREFGVGNNTTWRWDVTAVDAPLHNLRIEVYVHIPVKNKDGSDTYSVNSVLIRSVPIPVHRTWGQKFDDAFQWLTRSTNGLKLLTAFLVALGALLTAWFALPRLRGRGNPPGTPSPNQG